MRSTVFICMLLMVPLALIDLSLAQEKPRAIKVIGTGKAEGMPVLTTWFTTEPSTDPTIVPTRVWGAVNPTDIRRFMRIYFPRTYDDLLDYEFYFMAQVDLFFFTPEQQQWIYDALTNNQIPMSRVIVSTHLEGLNLAPNNILLSGFELQLASLYGREYVLSRQLDSVKGGYD